MLFGIADSAGRASIRDVVRIVKRVGDAQSHGLDAGKCNLILTFGRKEREHVTALRQFYAKSLR